MDRKYFTDDRWCSNIHRKQGIREISRTGTETYLTDKFPGVISGMFIISKEFPRLLGVQSYFRYTAFRSYPEIYKYLVSICPEERRLHEIVGEYVPQKPRFDIDVDYDKYLLALQIDQEYENDSIMTLGNRIKDIVIESVITIMKLKNYELDLDKDFMIFTSHGIDSKGRDKSSYHIILNRYFHHGCAQAGALYTECMKISADPKLFNLLVDGSIYRRGGSLRMMWSSKVNNMSRVKRYTPEFTYKTTNYQHSIDMDTLITPELQQMFILASSLITFVDESSPMPVLCTPNSDRPENECLTAEIYTECKKLIKAWDLNKSYFVDGTQNGIITLARLSPAYCILCDRVHSNMGTFCYLAQSQLFWHCGHARGKGSVCIGRIQSIKTAAEAFVEGIYNNLNASVIFLDTTGELISPGTSVTYSSPVLSLAGKFENISVCDSGKLSAVSKFYKSVPQVIKYTVPVQQEDIKIIAAPISVEILELRRSGIQPKPQKIKLHPDTLEIKVLKEIAIKNPIKTLRTTKKWTTLESSKTLVESNSTSQSNQIKYSLKNKRCIQDVVFL